MPIQLPGFLVSVFQKQLKMFLHDGFIHFELLSGLILINTIIFLRLRFLTCWLCCAFLYVGRGANNLSLILALRVGSGFGGIAVYSKMMSSSMAPCVFYSLLL